MSKSTPLSSKELSPGAPGRVVTSVSLYNICYQNRNDLGSSWQRACAVSLGFPDASVDRIYLVNKCMSSFTGNGEQQTLETLSMSCSRRRQVSWGFCGLYENAKAVLQTKS